MKFKNEAVIMVSLLAGLALLTGCPPKKKLAIEKPPVEEKKEEQAQPAEEKKIEITQDWTEIPALEMVHFDFDMASLNPAARDVLKNNVAILKKLPDSVTIRVEGHCDDRGTIEYNVALGQKRANSVLDFYRKAGIPKKRLETISYGEERPLCVEPAEDCWARNRRGVTKVRNKENISLKESELK